MNIFPVRSNNAATALALEVGQRLLERLDVMHLHPDHILNLSCNSSYVSHGLTRCYGNTKISVCDLADLASLPTRSIDLIISNLMLHRRIDIETVFANLKRTLKPGGLLLFSTLGPDTLKELRQSLTTIKHTDAIPPFTDMHNIGDILAHTQFADPVIDMEKIIFTYVDFSSLAHDLNGFENLNLKLLSENHLQKLITSYENYRSDSHLLPVTLEIIYGHAWNTMSTPHSSAPSVEVFVPLNTINKVRTKK